MTSADMMTVLDRATVTECLEHLDPVEIVSRTLTAHTHKETVLPAEGYLGWKNSEGAYSRSLAMLGGLTNRNPPLYGLKVVNASTSNPGLGIERAGGMMMIFDPETARPCTLAEAAVISALRTAAYTILSMQHLGPLNVERVSVLGCGTLARMHMRLLARYLRSLRSIHIYDVLPERAEALLKWAAQEIPALDVVVAEDARTCVAAGQVLITVTVSDTPYIDSNWFAEPTFIAHVSLDDVDRSVFEGAEAIIVDDVNLVVDNPRRILGSLVADGTVAAAPHPHRPSIAGTLGDVLAGRVKAGRPGAANVVSNPFGMAILDVALLGEVGRVADEFGLGFNLDLVGSVACG